ncbi:MAG: DUF3014 domain-containing protein [Vicinamibacterales bacterium]
MVDAPEQMRDEADYEIVKPPIDDSQSSSPKSPLGWWVVALGLVVVTVAAYFWWNRQQPAPVSTAAADVAAPAEAPKPAQALGGDAVPIDLPPLDQTDALVRRLLAALSSHPRVAAWLTTNSLVRNFTVVVANIADGDTPTKHLAALKPSSSFTFIARGDDRRIDPRSYERYDGLAAAATSIDPAGAARLYSALKPRIEEAYRELGQPDTPFDRTLERAIVQLLETPVVEGTPRLMIRGGTGYAYVNPGLERLTAAQKQLLRTGPANVQKIQGSLRAIALAMGIPASRLPATRTVREQG